MWNPKGGQGKSTIALNLAAAAVYNGNSAVLIDRDEQGTSTLYAAQRHLPFSVLAAYPATAPDADLIVIDHMANDRRVPEPMLIVMPVIPTRSQYAAYVEARQLAERRNKRIITVVNNGDVRRLEERRVALALTREGATEIRASSAFGKADSEYRTIFDAKLKNAYGMRERRAELLELLDRVMLA